jgi:hypothetical protein
MRDALDQRLVRISENEYRVVSAGKPMRRYRQRPTERRYREWRLLGDRVVDQQGHVVAHETLVYRRTGGQAWLRFLIGTAVWSGYTLPGETWLWCRATGLRGLRWHVGPRAPSRATFCRRCGKQRTQAEVCHECAGRIEPCGQCGGPRKRGNKTGLCLTCYHQTIRRRT